MGQFVSSEKKSKDDSKTFEQLCRKSESFRVNFPLNSNRLSAMVQKMNKDPHDIADFAEHTYPLVGESLLVLMEEFLKLKCKHGTEVEKEVYRDMNVVGFVDRLLKKRAVAFLNRKDSYLLLNNSRGAGGWEYVGTEKEMEPLTLKNCLSYDEIKISALLTVSSPTFLINNGNRQNKGERDKSGNFAEAGVYIGAVGARFEKPNFMEWQDMIITSEQNTLENGYGPAAKYDGNLSKIWAKFYGVGSFPVFQTEIGFGNVLPIPQGWYLNTDVYKKRIGHTLEIIFLEANKRAEDYSKKMGKPTTSYLHLVGLGLGVWEITPDQDRLFLEAAADTLEKLSGKLPRVSDVDFSWFKSSRCGGVRNGQKFPRSDITVHFSKRNPFDKLVGNDRNKLIVAVYAWDGNALPGNEYWFGDLSASGDPAAASCSQISELQNPHINDRVSGENLHIASRNYGILSYTEYSKKNPPMNVPPVSSSQYVTGEFRSQRFNDQLKPASEDRSGEEFRSSKGNVDNRRGPTPSKLLRDEGSASAPTSSSQNIKGKSQSSDFNGQSDRNKEEPRGYTPSRLSTGEHVDQDFFVIS